MEKKCMKIKKHSRMRAFVLSLALAMALLVTGCGKITIPGIGAGGGSAGSAGEDASGENKGGEDASTAGKTGAETAAVKADAASGKTGAETAAVKADAASGKTGAETAAEKADAAAAKKAGDGSTAAAAKGDPLTEKAEGGSVGKDTAKTSGSGEEDKYAGYSEFKSSKMGFSFRYDPENKAEATDTGACEMVIGKEKDLTGLFVSSLSAVDMPEASQILEEEAGDVKQKYKNSMVKEPEKSSLTVDDHDLTGQTWAYSLPSGGTVECSSYIEVRGGRYIFFKTEAMRGDTAPAADALKLAIRTLKIAQENKKTADSASDSTAKAASAEKKSKDEKEKDKKSKDEKTEDSKKEESQETVGIADLTGGGADEKESETETFGEAYSFDVDEKWLVVPKGTSTTVYTRGSMQGAYFVVDKIDMEEKPANYFSNRVEEITKNLGGRLLADPEVKTVELGERKLTGIEYEYVSADGARNLYQAEYIETTALGIFSWELACNQGDNESVAAMLSAMESFMPNLN